MMRSSILLAAFLAVALAGCGHVSLPEAVHRTAQELHVVPVLAQGAAKEWGAQIDDRIAYCKAQGDLDAIEREKCLGRWGHGDAFEGEAKAVAEAYDEAARALEKLEAAARRLEALIAPKETSP